MLIKFKSEGAGDVMMFGDVARKLMEIMGKEPADKGIITVEQLPEAIARLEQAMEEDRAARRGQPPAEEEDQEDDEEARKKRDPVGIARRALPLLELLEHARKEKEPVVWGI